MTRDGELAGELKYVTILRADLVASTRLVVDLSPEGAVDRLEPALAAMRKAIRRYGGIVCRELGDGLLAVFGAPVAQDNHASLGLHAAFELVQQVAQLGDANLRVRVGVHSGTVVTQVISNEYSKVYDMGGPALNLVERLQSAAEPGQIFVSEACYKLAEGYVTFEPLGLRRLKGFGAAMPLYRATGLGEATSWRVRISRSSAPFVGREAEMQVLREALDAAAAGTSRIISITGEPGIGKSRLMHEFAETARRSGWRVVESGCSAILQAAPYASLKGLLTSASNLGDESRLGEAGADGEAQDPKARLAPIGRAAIDAVLGLSIAEPAWHAMTPAARGRAIGDACRCLVEAVTRRAPTVLVIEDIHWIDGASDTIIEGLLSKPFDNGALVLVSGRPTGCPAWVESRSTTTLRLGPLGDAASASLLDAMLGQPLAGAGLKRRILSHTGRIPLFMEEVCRRLAEPNRLQGQHVGEASPDLERLGVPPTVQGVIAVRIDGLAMSERKLLQMAAALGPRCTLETLGTVAEISETLLQHPLNALVDANLFVPVGSDSLAFEFPHDLVRQVAYESMLESTRVRLHGNILAALELEAKRSVDDRSSTLCHHARLAQDWKKTVEYARNVARTCIARSALADATAHLEIAIGSLDRLPLAPQRERDAIDLRIESRMAFSGFGRVDRWLELAREAASRAKAIGDTSREVAASAVRSAALNFHGSALEAVAEGEKVLREARELNDCGWINYTEYGLGQAYFVAGRYREAERILAHTHAQLAGPEGRSIVGTTVRGMLLMCCMMQSVVHASLGERVPARWFWNQARDSAGESQRPVELVAADYCGGVCLIAHGEPAAAQQLLEAALALAREHDVKLFATVIACQLGIALLEQAMTEEARQVLIVARSEAETIGHTSAALRASVNLALALAQLGATDEARRMARRAGLVARRCGFRGLEAEALAAESSIAWTADVEPTAALVRRLRKCMSIASELEAAPVLGPASELLDQVLQRSRLPSPHPEGKVPRRSRASAKTRKPQVAD